MSREDEGGAERSAPRDLQYLHLEICPLSGPASSIAAITIMDHRIFLNPTPSHARDLFAGPPNNFTSSYFVSFGLITFFTGLIFIVIIT